MKNWLQTLKNATESPPDKPTLSLPSAREWYYLKAGQPVGAFSYPEMIRQLQTKQISLTTIVWRQGMKDWAPALSTAELHPKTVKKWYLENAEKMPQTFAERKHKRSSYCAQFVLHNQKQIWRALSFEIGAGGLGVIADTTELSLGQELFLHKVSIGFGPSINAMVRVVSVSRHGMRPGQARYGLEFSDIGAQIQREIMDFAESLC